MQVRRARWKKGKLPRSVECLVSAYRIRFEQAEECTGLADKEERKTMKKRMMRTDTINHYRVDYILHLDEKVYVLVLFMLVQSISKNGCSTDLWVRSIRRLVKSPLFLRHAGILRYTSTLVTPDLNRHAAKCAEIRYL